MSGSDLVLTLDEFAFALRMAGVHASVGQVLAAARALAMVGLEDRERVRTVLLSCLVSRAEEREIASRVFDAFFLRQRRPRSIEEALVAAGLDSAIDIVRAWVASEDVAMREADLAFLVRQAIAVGDSQPTAMRAHGVANRARLNHARYQLGTLALALRGAIDADTADRALAVVEHFVDEAMQVVREAVTARQPMLDDRSVPELQSAQLDRALREAAGQLRCRLRRRQRVARGQTIDARAFLRSQARAHGVPLRVPRLRNRRKPPALFFLCDVSDSNRHAVALLLQFMTRAAHFFKRSRCFVFASTTSDVTRELARGSVSRALEDQAVGQLSNYGLAFREFAKLTRTTIDRRSVVVVLGDGRANYRDPGLTELRAIRNRVRELIWLCSEPQNRWSADSLMPRYRLLVSRFGQLATFRDVPESARLMGSLR